MAEIPPTQGSKALKIVLIVGAILLGICVLCVGGFWFLGGKDVYNLSMPFVGLQTAASTKYTQGATITLTGESEDSFTIALGVQGGIPAEDITAAQDWLWQEYTKAFADGGFPVRRLAVGTLRGGSNVSWDDEGEIDVDVVAARTGIAVPPVNAFLAKQMAKAGGSGNVKVRIGAKADGSADENADGSAPPKDDGEVPDEQK